MLNAPEVVKAQTRESVEAAIADLGYTPHFGGRALASNRTNTIGVVIPTMENAIFARGLQAMEDELSQSGITLLVATSHYSVEREGQQIKALLARGIDGLALIGEARPESTYGLLKKSGVPVVLLWTGQTDRDFPHLGFDNRGAARAMTELVLDEGHKVIAMLAGPTDGNDRASDRVLGVQDALKARGMTLPPRYLVESPYDLEKSAMAAARLLSLDPRPTALICGNDVIAAGAISGARRSGQNVPQDVSVVGYDDIDLAIAVEPQLTTVRVPHQRMGQAAAKTLHRLIGGEIPAKNQIFDFQIIRRSSLARAG